MISSTGFREIPHTADCEIEVWAPDIPSLFISAAQGMYALSGINLKGSPPIRREITFSGIDPEYLLVSFLSELLYLSEEKNEGFDHFGINIDGKNLRVIMEGSPVKTINRNIKAVTYHDLVIRCDVPGYRVNIVFDV